MKSLSAVLLAALAVAGLVLAAGAQNNVKQGEDVATEVQSSPRLNDIMVQQQMRHIKLWFAGDARNWPLADYELDQLKDGFDDVAKLLEVLHELVEGGNTVVVIEHNLEVIKTADWVIDLGPEGGDGGGEIVAAGTPEDVVAAKKSYTGQFLAPVLRRAAPKRKKRVEAAE